MRRIGVSEESMTVSKSNLANTYRSLGRFEEALRMRRAVYSGYLRLHGEEHRRTLSEANCLANLLIDLKRYEEAKSELKKVMPVAQRVLGENNGTMLTMRRIYAATLYENSAATLGDLREAVTTLKETERIARRMLGGAPGRRRGRARTARGSRITPRP